MTSPLDQAQAVGDAVLYEGYLLYPYRASAGKNKVRWQWGVLMPPAFASPDIGEHSGFRAECLVEPRPDTVVQLRLRFLHAQARVVEQRDGNGYREVPSLVVDGIEYTTWDEAVERTVDAVFPVRELLAAPVDLPFGLDGGEEFETLGTAGRIVRRTRPLAGTLRVGMTPLDGPYGGARLRVDAANTTDWMAGAPGDPIPREGALRHALLAAHLVLGLDSGHFLSMLDPPEWARPAVDDCVNERIWPVLIGGTERSATMLCTPIILYDDPTIAAESQGELFDGTEIDEILTLRTMALTDEEKRQARATDDRVRELVDRVDSMPGELLERLHGTVRYLRSAAGEAEPAGGPAPPEVPWWDPGADEAVSPETDSVVVAGVAVASGSRVRLRPALRGSDAQDMFLTGRIATVRAVLSDVDGGCHVAVTVDDDPAAELQNAHGRYRYFSPDEIEPCNEAEASR